MTKSDDCLLVIFGATGDLARRKLYPALDELQRRSLLPSGLRVLAVGRTEPERALPALREAIPPALLACLDYLRMDYDAVGFRALKDRCAHLAPAAGGALFYLAIPPSAYGLVAAGLHEAGLARGPADAGWSRLLVEKPFGTDAATSAALNRQLLAGFREDQIYRMDHYLGKSATYLPLDLRASDPALDEAWRRRTVRYIRITSRETLGCGDRSGYFDGVGILRDMVQSHLMQILSLVLMDVPAGADPARVRAGKIRALADLLPVDLTGSLPTAVRAQYGAGPVDGGHCPAYADEAGVLSGSRRETYACLKLYSRNLRWEGVPLYLEAGKRLARKETCVELGFAEAGPLAGLPGSPARLLLRLQPEAEAVLELADGTRAPLEAGSGRRGFAESLGTGWDRDGYPSLLLHAFAGQRDLFVDADEVDLAWRCLDPLLSHWERPEADADLTTYAPGSLGPWQAVRVLPDGATEAWPRVGSDRPLASAGRAQ